jgi:hypothetical protein
MLTTSTVVMYRPHNTSQQTSISSIRVITSSVLCLSSCTLFLHAYSYNVCIIIPPSQSKGLYQVFWEWLTSLNWVFARGISTSDHTKFKLHTSKYCAKPLLAFTSSFCSFVACPSTHLTSVSLGPLIHYRGILKFIESLIGQA